MPGGAIGNTSPFEGEAPGSSPGPAAIRLASLAHGFQSESESNVLSEANLEQSRRRVKSKEYNVLRLFS